MGGLPENDRRILIRLARSVITAELVAAHPIERPETIPASLKEKRGCFVTLHKHEALRGCIGTIEPVKSLLRCVEENALNAAFHDPRFSPVQRDELDALEIEISVLTLPRPLDTEHPDGRLAALKPGVHGVILSKGYHRATFLPQVWDQLPEKKQFLTHLCQKAGIGREDWQSTDTTIDVYEVEFFSEESI